MEDAAEKKPYVHQHGLRAAALPVRRFTLERIEVRERDTLPAARQIDGPDIMQRNAGKQRVDPERYRGKFRGSDLRHPYAGRFASRGSYNARRSSPSSHDEGERSMRRSASLRSA